MKSYDFYAVVYDSEVFCLECLEVDVDDDDDVSPIFADDEWDYTPCCSVCGEVFDYMNILEDNEDNEYNEDEDNLESEEN